VFRLLLENMETPMSRRPQATPNSPLIHRVAGGLMQNDEMQATPKARRIPRNEAYNRHAAMTKDET